MRRLLALVVCILLGGCATYMEQLAERIGDGADQARLESGAHSTVSVPTSSRRCGGIVGTPPKFEPLRSSKPFFTDYFLQGVGGPGRTLERQIRAASLRHDFCYGHGAATYGFDRDVCDRNMMADMQRICLNVNAANEGGCQMRAGLAYLAVHWFGGDVISNNVPMQCDYEDQPTVARSFMVSGRFFDRTQLSFLTITADTSNDAVVVAKYDPSAASSEVLRRIETTRTPIYRSTVKPTSGKPECLAGHGDQQDCTNLSDFKVTALDLLHKEPVAVDVNGDSIDELVLVGLDIGDGSRGFGAFVVPLSIAAADATAAAFPLRNAKCGIGEADSCFQAADNGDLGTEIEELTTRSLVGHFLPATPYDPTEGRQQIAFLTMSTGVGNTEGLKLRLLDFSAGSDGQFVLRSYLAQGSRDGWQDEASWRPGDRHNELFRRVQNNAFVASTGPHGTDEIHVLFRAKRQGYLGNDDRSPGQPLLLEGLRYSPAGLFACIADTSCDNWEPIEQIGASLGRPKPVQHYQIANWNEAAYPWFTFASPIDGKQILAATYLESDSRNAERNGLAILQSWIPGQTSGNLGDTPIAEFVRADPIAQDVHTIDAAALFAFPTLTTNVGPFGYRGLLYIGFDCPEGSCIPPRELEDAAEVARVLARVPEWLVALEVWPEWKSAAQDAPPFWQWRMHQCPLDRAAALLVRDLTSLRTIALSSIQAGDSTIQFVKPMLGDEGPLELRISSLGVAIGSGNPRRVANCTATPAQSLAN